MSYLFFDLAILAILLAFALRGLRRGLILSLFSLLSVLVALAGAILLSNLWSPAVADRLEPVIRPGVTSAVETAIPDSLIETGTTREHLLSVLAEAELPFGLGKYLPEPQEQADEQEPARAAWIAELSDTLTEKLSAVVAKNGLFLLCFVLILILWKLLARALDLVARLPGLHGLNRLGGFLLGAMRGALALFVLAWLVRWLWSGLIPDETVEQSILLRFFMTAGTTRLSAG